MNWGEIAEDVMVGAVVLVFVGCMLAFLVSFYTYPIATLWMMASLGAFLFMSFLVGRMISYVGE